MTSKAQPERAAQSGGRALKIAAHLDGTPPRGLLLPLHLSQPPASPLWITISYGQHG